MQVLSSHVHWSIHADYLSVVTQEFHYEHTHRMYRRLEVLVDDKLNCGRGNGVARVKTKHQLEHLPLKITWLRTEVFRNERPDLV